MSDGTKHWSDEQLSAWIDGELPTDEAARVEAHLATCGRCTRSVEALRAIIAAAGSLEARAPERDLWPDVERHLSRRERPVRRWTSVLAGLAAGVLLTLGANRLLAPTASPDGGLAERERFVLLLHDSPDLLADATPQEIEAVVAEYRAWAQGLGRQGKLEAGEKLADAEGYDLERRDGATLVELRDARGGVGGFFVIRARDYEEAVAISRSCPHLTRGGRIELRRIEDT